MYEKLNKILREKSISVNQLSFKAQISSPDLYQALSGKRPMFPAWRRRIAEALEVSEAELFGEELEK